MQQVFKHTVFLVYRYAYMHAHLKYKNLKGNDRHPMQDKCYSGMGLEWVTEKASVGSLMLSFLGGLGSI